MSKIYQIISRYPVLDRFLLLPYDDAAFERYARRYAIGPRSSLLYAILASALAILMFFGTSVCFVSVAKSFYLEFYGAEVPARILDVSFHDSYRSIKWKKISYEFRVSSGEVVEGQADRPVQEFAGVPDNGRLTVLYWDRFPTVNRLRGVQSNIGIMAVLTAIVFFFCLYFAFASKRLFRWRNAFIASQGRSRRR